MKDKEDLLKSHGWSIDCYSPFEISTADGDVATGLGAELVVLFIQALEKGTIERGSRVAVRSDADLGGNEDKRNLVGLVEGSAPFDKEEEGVWVWFPGLSRLYVQKEDLVLVE